MSCRSYQRLFACGMRHCGKRYRSFVDQRKRRLFADIAGDVLEIGSGTGVNLQFLPRDVRYCGVDPNPHMHGYARDSASRAGRRAEFSCMDAAALGFDDARFDAVVCTLVLCSVVDQVRVLAEVRRVLRPGGRFVFMEHVAATAGSRTRKWQERSAPLWRVVGDGCSPVRDTESAIRSSGFDDVTIEHFGVPVPVFGPHISGIALNS